MSSERTLRLLNISLWITVLALGSLATAVWATETAPPSNAADNAFFSQLIQYLKTNYTRATWDLVMRWVNFLILVAVIIKYARTPVVGFLRGKQAETARAIERIEAEKQLAEQKVRQGRIKLQASQQRLDMIRDRIVSEGQRQKAKMIDAAKHESRIMLESARSRVDNQIRDAYQVIRAELIELAAEKAMSKLPRLMTDQDHERMVGLWMDSAG
ncbi:MAG: ATP synthase F0 subunit B [Desulfobacteraceae bacterium]|jgi:F-type H+-transporting ATPase subunit b